MTLKIDKAGRIVLPKVIRDRLGLRAGSELRLSESEEGLTLSPVRLRPSMVLEKGMWVHSGKLPQTLSWDSLVDDDREERIKDLSGL